MWFAPANLRLVRALFDWSIFLPTTRRRKYRRRRAPPDAHADALLVRSADLKGIETDQNFVDLKLPSDQIYLAPLKLLADTPFEGGPHVPLYRQA
jgi:hypothetical protein